MTEHFSTKTNYKGLELKIKENKIKTKINSPPVKRGSVFGCSDSEMSRGT